MNVKAARQRTARFFRSKLNRKRFAQAGRRVLNILKYVPAFLIRHRRMSESFLCGGLAAVLFHQLPWLGNTLAVVALAAGGIVGVLRELKHQLDVTFLDPKD